MSLLSVIAESRRRYLATILADSPIAYWRLGEASGTTAADEMGSYAGIYAGSPTLGVSGAIGDGNTAVSLNGSSQYVAIGSPAGLNLTSGTVEAWVNVAAYPAVAGTVFTRIKNNASFFNSPALVVLAAGTANFSFQDGSSGNYFSITSTATVPTGSWSHLVATYNASVAKIYLNGSEIASGSVAGTIVAGTNYMTSIGARKNQSSATWERHLNATIDEVAIYPTEISAARRLAHYNAR